MVNTNRPYVICHMMSTIDGKIDSGIKGIDILVDYYYLYSNIEKTLKPQAWMCGRVTSEMFASAVGRELPKNEIKINHNDFVTPITTANFLLAVDTKGLLRWDIEVITFGDNSKHQLVVVVIYDTPKEYLSYLQGKKITYIFAGEKEIDFSLLFQKLKQKLHIDTLVLEGGAHLNGSVMASGLVDEISLLMTPLVLNRTESPSLFERKTDQIDLKKYSLLEVKQMENDAVLLRYKKYEI